MGEGGASKWAIVPTVLSMIVVLVLVVVIEPAGAPDEGGRGVFPYLSFLGTFRTSEYPFQGIQFHIFVSEQGCDRKSRFLPFQPHNFSLISCAFVRENANCNVCIVLNTAMFGTALSSLGNYSTFS